MEITEIRIKLENKMRLKAFANVTFDDVFVVRGLKIVEGKDGLFVTMPARKLQDGSYKDIAHPVTNDFRIVLEKYVLDAYTKVLNNTKDQKTN